jgi:hypothetical protein
MKIKNTLIVLLMLLIVSSTPTLAQSNVSRKKVLIDVGHGQRFYRDPADTNGQDPDFMKRVKYLTGEVKKNASKLNREMGFIKAPITAQGLANCDILFIHAPSAQFSADEVKAIQQFVDKGGALFLVIDVDYWSTLAQTNVNDIVKPYDIVFKTDNAEDQSDGGHTNPGPVTTKRFSIPYHGARLVEGGTPFCYSNATDKNPFGVYKEVKKGKIIAMGDGMASLYMNEWKDVNNYQCSEFMHDVFAWLLK